MKKLIVGCYCLLLSSLLFGQDSSEGLWNTWNNTAQSDTVRLKAFSDYIVDEYLYSDPDSALFYTQQLLNFASTHQSRKWEGNAYRLQGMAYFVKGEYEQASASFESCLEVNKELNFTEGIGGSLNNIAAIANQRGQYIKALDYYAQALIIFETLNQPKTIGIILSNIGIIYNRQNEYQKAIQILKRSIEIGLETSNKRLLSGNFNNLATAYLGLELTDSALFYYQKSHQLKIELEDDFGKMVTLRGMGQCKLKQGKTKEALQLATESFEMANAIDNKKEAAGAMGLLADIHFQDKNYLKAIELSESALEYENLPLSQKSSTCKLLYDCHKILGNKAASLEYFEKYVALDKELTNNEVKSELLKFELEYEYKQKKLIDSLQFAMKTQLKDAKIEEQNKQIESDALTKIGLLVIILFALAIIFLVFRNNDIKKRDNEIIKMQKAEVESQRDEITSLNNNLELLVTSKTTQLESSLEKLRKHQWELAHEIKAPIATLLGLMHLVQDNKLESEENQIIFKMLQQNASNISAVISQISQRLDVSEENPEESID